MNVAQAMLAMLFEQFPGFERVRMVAAKPGVAFVDFDPFSTTILPGNAHASI
jgi:hypothetical protein